MLKESQMQKNGGYYWHCHKCNKNYVALNEDRARRNAHKHIKQKGHTGVAFWSFGLLEACPYN